jgi:hypothetical protein
VYWIVRGPALPAPGSDVYEQASRAFYHGLAALEVGLLDDARSQFTRVTELVAVEPAAWANLALAELRLGELDRAAAPVARALELAPAHGGIALLAGRMEAARGNLDAGIAHLRRAVSLDPGGLKARSALAEEIERAGGPDAEREALALFDELARRAPENLAVLVERARLSARTWDRPRLEESVAALARQAASFPELARTQLELLNKAAADGRFDDAIRGALLLRNVLTPAPAFLEGLRAVRTPAELIADPLDGFLALARASAMPAPPDTALTFSAEPISPLEGVGAMTVFSPDPSPGAPPAVVAATPRTIARLGRPGEEWSSEEAAPVSAGSVAAGDWNHDFRTDLAAVRPGELVLFMQQADGSLAAPVRPRLADGNVYSCACHGVWAADVEMDGDLDLVVATREGPVDVLRNNGDGTWRVLRPFGGIAAARAFAWADLDRDADPDAVVLDARGAIHVLANRQAGTFSRLDALDAPAAGMTVADLDADGGFDVVTLAPSGAVNLWSRRGTVWETREIAAWDGLSSATGLPREAGGFRLLTADLDNNGALDVVASGPAGTRVWLTDQQYVRVALPGALEADVHAIADLDGDGRLDLVAASSGRPVRLRSRGQAAYHWKVVRARAQQQAGDQRINAFGVGGDVEVRSGLLVQKQILTGTPAHFGLGTRTAIDVVRIVWPNGVAQAEFGVDAGGDLVAEQRLKGSCPWVFAWDGAGIRFVTDFLWRSPLGLRINARDTAGVVQTEDWIRIGGDQLAARNGIYDVRITAELWETHFFDAVALMAVDHPADVDALVDERFLASARQALTVEAVAGYRPVTSARDERGRDVTGLVSRQDGRYLATFDRGAYQGVAADHAVEFEFGEPVPREGRPVLVARGWVYPTDSSINVAIGQGTRVRPGGVALDAGFPDGRWRLVDADIGFPAGKNKTMLVDLRGAGGARRLRLRTNLEVYWDRLALARIVDAPVRVTRLEARGADLRFRGFSRTESPRDEAPETPQYDRIANVTQRWRDLTGLYTRFGDVRELLASVDDRYVIMNAGDELRLEFAELPPPPAGWRRDFVLAGDGWEKDGDYNTAFSEAVLPLPSHGDPYGAAAPARLEDDPVYRRHRGDWERFHTRFVTPRGFVDGLAR